MSVLGYGQNYIDTVGQRYNIPLGIWRGLIATESGYNPNAANPNSSAFGYTQLLKGTAADLGINRFDPAQNLEGGARYLSQQYDTFRDWNKALAAYYQGPASVAREGINEAGQSYISRVFGNAGKRLEDFGRKTADFAKDEAVKAGRAVLAGVTGGASEVAIAGANALGIGGDDCGTLDFVCKLRKWFKEGDFFNRFGFVIIGLIFVVASLYFLGQSQAKAVVNLKG